MVTDGWFRLNFLSHLSPIWSYFQPNSSKCPIRPKMPELEQFSEYVNILQIMMSIGTLSLRLSLPLISSVLEMNFHGNQQIINKWSSDDDQQIPTENVTIHLMILTQGAESWLQNHVSRPASSHSNRTRGFDTRTWSIDDEQQMIDRWWQQMIINRWLRDDDHGMINIWSTDD